MVVDRGVEVIPWIDLDMHFNPHPLFIVIGQDGNEDAASLQRGGNNDVWDGNEDATSLQ
jgi:hypothetical protein